MFLDNKYTKYYRAIISRAASISRSKKSEYFEAHHVVPKSLGGTNSKTNLVLLTGREHFLCHFLLTKMFQRQSNNHKRMLHAFMLLKGSNSHQQRYINSRLYENIKRDYAQIRSKARKGKTLSAEHRKKISETLKGHTVSNETRALISAKAKTRKRKPFSDEYKARHSATMKQRHRWKTKHLISQV